MTDLVVHLFDRGHSFFFWQLHAVSLSVVDDFRQLKSVVPVNSLIWHVTVADFYCVSVKNLVWWVFGRKFVVDNSQTAYVIQGVTKKRSLASKFDYSKMT